MYYYGLVKFLQAKKLKSNECINAFLISEGITDFTAKNHNRVNEYIDKHWIKFAAFVDKSIKNGNIQGKAVKLNTYYDEKAEWLRLVKNEFEEVKLTKEESDLLGKIKNKGVSHIQSFLHNKGVTGLGKDYSYKSKTLQWLPLVKKAIENGYSIS
jgi:hypothetical protein